MDAKTQEKDIGGIRMKWTFYRFTCLRDDASTQEYSVDVWAWSASHAREKLWRGGWLIANPYRN